MGHFATIADVKAANEAAGCFFFSPRTMRFFNSRVDSRIYGGRFFVTSERQDADHPRLYTVREVGADGRVDDAAGGGGFQAYRTLQGARNRAQRLAEQALRAEQVAAEQE